MGDVAAVRIATPFIGRAAELERLRELLNGAAAGSSAAVLLAGDAGVGKTSLATEFGRHARESGAMVLTGRNVDLGSGGLPYLPFSEALAQVLREGAGESPTGERARAARDVVLKISQLRPSLARLIGRDESVPAQRAPGDADLDRLALFEAVNEALVQIATTVAPVIVVIEDLHWAEQSTRDLVRFLLSRIGNDRLMFMATYRADDLHRRHPVRSLLAELLRLPSVELMELHPFDDAELTDFLEAVHGGELPANVVRRIGDRSAGNAYFAEELLSAGSGDDRLPTALADVLIDRLERLQPATQQLMRVASVIGAFRIEDGLLRTAAVEGAALSEADADAAVRDAVAHQVLVADDADRFGFRHALLQEAVYEDLLPGEKVRLHGVIARLLAARDALPDEGGAGDAAEQARHSLAAHDLPQALAASLRAASAAARRLAPAEALNQYEQVLQLWDSVPPDRRPPGAGVVAIGLSAADAAGDAGLRERAVALAESAITAAGDDAALVSQARSTLAVHLYAMDRTAEVIDVARLVIGAHPGASLTTAASTPTPALVRARAIMARSLYSTADLEGAMDTVRPGLTEARTLGLRAEEADLEMTWSGVDSSFGRPDADHHLRLAREAAEAAGDPTMMLRVSYAGLIDRYEEGDFTGVLALISESLALAERAGLSNSLYATQCRWMLVNAHWMLGDPEAAMAAVLDGCRNLPTFGSRQIQHAALPILVARDPEDALQWARDLEAVRTNPWDEPGRWAAKAEAYAWLGDTAQSLEASRTAIDVLESLGEPYVLSGISMDTNAVGVAADVAAAARSAGDDASAVVADAQRLAADARERAQHGRPRRFRMGPEGLAWLKRLDAEAARLTGSDSVADWEAAVTAFDFGAVFEQARCRWRLAQRLLADGSRDAARAQLTLARGVAGSLGAQPLLAALDDLARRGRLDAGASAGSSSGPAGTRLTPRERDVMLLVAQGLTNRAIGERLFISEKTASVHVSNVLTKLGASGRAEAVSIATKANLI